MGMSTEPKQIQGTEHQYSKHQKACKGIVPSLQISGTLPSCPSTLTATSRNLLASNKPKQKGIKQANRKI